MTDIKLVALDLDGTLYNTKGIITQGSLDAIAYAASRGVHVVISTGRPYSGLPFDQVKGTAIRYSINTNGASAYLIEPKTCLFEEPLSDETSLRILDWLADKDVHIACFIQGEGISPDFCVPMVPDLIIPDNLKEGFRKTRKSVPDMKQYLRETGFHVQKMTLNFKPNPDGTPKNRDLIEQKLKSLPDLEVVCGGFQNLEFTRKGIDKGRALLKLADRLGVKPEETMAVGDTENDLAILKAAGLGIAMGNATEPVKAAADWIAPDNEHDGVAAAIYHFIK